MTNEFVGMSDEEFAAYVSDAGWMVRSDPVHVYIKAELLRRLSGLGAAVSASPQPKCPHCGSNNKLQWNAPKMFCGGCQRQFLAEKPQDFAQFFRSNP